MPGYGTIKHDLENCMAVVVLQHQLFKGTRSLRMTTSSVGIKRFNL